MYPNRLFKAVTFTTSKTIRLCNIQFASLQFPREDGISIVHLFRARSSAVDAVFNEVARHLIYGIMNYVSLSLNKVEYIAKRIPKTRCLTLVFVSSKESGEIDRISNSDALKCHKRCHTILFAYSNEKRIK